MSPRRLLPLLLLLAAPVGCSDSDSGAAASDTLPADTLPADSASPSDTEPSDRDAVADTAVDPDAAAPDGADPDSAAPDAVDPDGADSADSGPDVASDTAASSDADAASPDAGGPPDPVAIFGTKYWNVYRPHFLAHHYQSGRVSDRIEGGTPTFGDNTIWMGYALSTFVFEYQAADRARDAADRDDLNLDGWCVAWRWAKDFDNPERCLDEANPFVTYSGLDYLITRAMSAAFGEHPPLDSPGRALTRS